MKKNNYKNLSKDKLVKLLEQRDQECSCSRTREYEGGYGMRWIYHYENPRCPQHGNSK